MKLELITLTGPKFEEDAYEVMLPTSSGRISVLPGHMPLVTLAVPGVLGIRRHKGDDNVEYYATNGGVVEISKDKVRLLVDEADHADDIVKEEVEKALQEAKLAKGKAKNQIELDKAQQLIDRQVVRLKVADLRRHHHHDNDAAVSDISARN